MNGYLKMIGNQRVTDLQNVLAEDYKTQYNITESNVLQKLAIPALTNSTQYYQPLIQEMLVAQMNDSIYVYLIKGNARIVNGNANPFEFNVMLVLDKANNLYQVYSSSYMEKKGYDQLKIGNTMNNHTIQTIQPNLNNKYTYVSKTDEEMAVVYFNHYQELINYYPHDAYTKLDTQYAQKRFTNEENFTQYIQENQSVLTTMNIKKYKLTPYSDCTDYICADQYNNIYIFRQQEGTMQYRVFLDNYTVLVQEDVEYYNQLTKIEKGRYHLKTFIKEVNTKDFSAIYQSLDNTFRTNNFSTQEQLKSYLQNNMYELNSAEITSEDKSDDRYYIFKCKITNLENEKETKKMTIIIHEAEETNYTMSFSFNS